MAVVVDCGLNKSVVVVWVCDVPEENDHVRRAELEGTVGDLPHAPLPPCYQGKACPLGSVLVSQLLHAEEKIPSCLELTTKVLYNV